MRMRQQKKPLFRSVNTRTYGVRHGSGAKARWERNTKAAGLDGAKHGSMHSGQRHGFDYTPLFKFLLSRVGKDWDAVHSEAVARLDHDDPISWMVATDRSEGRALFQDDESAGRDGEEAAGGGSDSGEEVDIHIDILGSKYPRNCFLV